jgi:hypothetical protein
MYDIRTTYGTRGESGKGQLRDYMTMMTRLQGYEEAEKKAGVCPREYDHIANEACNALSSASSCSSAD